MNIWMNEWMLACAASPFRAPTHCLSWHKMLLCFGTGIFPKGLCRAYFPLWCYWKVVGMGGSIYVNEGVPLKGLWDFSLLLVLSFQDVSIELLGVYFCHECYHWPVFQGLKSTTQWSTRTFPPLNLIFLSAHQQNHLLESSLRRNPCSLMTSILRVVPDHMRLILFNSHFPHLRSPTPPHFISWDTELPTVSWTHHMPCFRMLPFYLEGTNTLKPVLYLCHHQNQPVYYSLNFHKSFNILLSSCTEMCVSIYRYKYIVLKMPFQSSLM